MMIRFRKLTKREKTIVILVAVVALLWAAGWKLIKAGSEQVTKGCTVIYPELSSYTENYRTGGKVISADARTYEVPGILRSLPVRNGQSVKEGDTLAVYEQDGETYTLKSAITGIVTKAQGTTVIVEDPSKLKVRFYIPLKIKKALETGKKVSVEDGSGTISFISELADDSFDPSMFETEADLEEGSYVLNSEVHIRVELSESKQVWKIPSACVLSASSGSYVFFASVLDHVSEIRDTDYEKVVILSEEGGYYLAEPLRQSGIVQPDGFAREYFSEAVKSL